MKKIIFLGISFIMLACLTLRAQTTEIKFINNSLSDEIVINIPDLFGEDIIISKGEIINIKVDNERLAAKEKHKIEVYYSACGNTEKAEIKIGKYNKIGDLREPCQAAKIEKCNYPEGRAFVSFINETGKEISILDGPLNGLSLSPDQESQIINFPVGRNSLMIESFIDTADHNKGVDKRNYKFFAIQDSSCLCKVGIKTIEDVKQTEDLTAKLKICVENRTDRKISIVSYPFDGISLLSGRKSAKIDPAKIRAGIYPIKIEYLDNEGNKVSKEVLKHLVEGDKVVSIVQKDIDIKPTPKVRDYSRNRPPSRSSRGYYSVSY